MTPTVNSHLEWRACAVDLEGGIALAWTSSLPQAQRELNHHRRAEPPYTDTFLERRWVSDQERVDEPDPHPERST